MIDLFWVLKTSAKMVRLTGPKTTLRIVVLPRDSDPVCLAQGDSDISGATAMMIRYMNMYIYIYSND